MRFREIDGMTRDAAFERRIGERMAVPAQHVAESQQAAPDRTDGTRPNGWVAEPELSDDAVRAGTGRGWDEWRELLDAWSSNDADHTAIATYVREHHRVDGWWAQTVTVGYERITGRRLPYQQPDGTFTINRSRTLHTDPEALRSMLLDPGGRTQLFPGMDTELRSRSTSKNVRVTVGPGMAEISLAPRDDGRVKVTVQHHRLPTHDEVEPWRAFWAAWLEAVDGA